MRGYRYAPAVVIAVLFACGNPSGPESDPGPEPSVLAAQFTGGWTPPDAGGAAACRVGGAPAPITIDWQVGLSWTMECSEVQFTEYELYRSTSPDIALNPDSAILLATFFSADDTSFTDTFGDWGEDYYYALRTLASDTLEAWSNEVFVSTGEMEDYGGPDMLYESVDVGGMPCAVCAPLPGEEVYVACCYDNAVRVISVGETFQVTGEVAVGRGPVDLCCSVDGGTVYAACRTDGTVCAIGTESHSLLWELPVGESPSGICLLPGTGHLAVSCSGDGMLAVVDPEQVAVIDSIEVGDGPADVCHLPGSELLLAADGSGGTVSVVDALSMSLDTTLQVGGSPWRLFPGTDGTSAYLGDAVDGEVRLVTAIQGSYGVSSAFEVEGGGSVVLPLSNGNLVYAAGYDDDSLSVMDSVTLDKLLILPVATRPIGICEDPFGRYLYVCGTAFGTVDVYGYDIWN